ncbi:MAG: hypothetical protein PHC43_05145 [Candidatus Marinimicrobia bacterium]|nr:hypothetical protein [Candidatus Neomarinimicrobiota bacterium]
MRDTELINKIKTLKNIKPEANWVSFARENLLNRIPENGDVFGAEKFGFSRVFSYPVLKPVALTLSALIFVSAFGGAFFITAKAAPGESFYSVKLTYQNLKANLVSEDQKPQTHLDFAFGRLEDLGKVREEKKDAGVIEATKQIANDFSNATDSLNEIKDPSKKITAGINLVKQVSKFENTLTKEKENKNLSQESQDKISEAEKLAQEIKDEIMATLISDSENNNDYRKMVEDLQKEIEQYENETKTRMEDSAK